MYKPQFLFILNLSLVFFFSISNAQIDVSGFIKDKDNSPIEGAAITITDSTSLILAFTYSKSNGKYTIALNNVNNTYVIVSAQSLGFIKQTDTLYLTPNIEKYSIDFMLNENLEQLNEVIIKPDAKIKREGNKVVYKVSSFTDKTEQTVEDVLKKIPGVEVLDNGIIKAHGRNIDKLLIEGDDMFDKNYTMLSKNLDGQVLSSIEILEGFEDNPVLAKVLSSNKVAINLKLKEKYKNVWFGNLIGGLGTEHRFNAGSNIGLLKKRIKFFNFNNYNNLGNYASEQVNTERQTNSNVFYAKKEQLNFNTLYDVPESEVPFFKNNEAAFNNAFINSLSIVKTINQKLKFRGTGYFLKDSEDFIRNSQTIFNTNSETIIYNESKSLEKKRPITGGDLELKFNVSENSYLKNVLTFKQDNTNAHQSLIFNDNPIREGLNTNISSFFNHTNYTLLAGKQLIHNYVYFGNTAIDQNLQLISPTLNTVFNKPTDNIILNTSKDKATTFGAKSALRLNLGKVKNTIEASYEFLKEQRHNVFKISVNELSSIDSLQNNIDYKQNAMMLKSTTNYKLSKKIEFSGAVSGHFLNLKTDQSINNRLFLNTKLGLRLKNLRIGTISLNYTRDYSTPFSNVLLPNFQLTNFQSFNRGTTELFFTRRNKYRFSYSISNSLNTNSFSLYAVYIKTNGRYSSRNTIDQNFSFSTADIVDGGKTMITKIDYTSYFRKAEISTTIGTLQNWTSTPFLFNSSNFSDLQLYSASYFLRGRTYFKIPVNFNFNLNFSQNKSTINGITSRSNWKSLSLNTNFKLSKIWVASFSKKFYLLENGNYNFLNFELNFNPKASRFSYRFTFNNILNEDFFIIDNVDEISSFNSSFRLLPRYLYIQAKYRF